MDIWSRSPALRRCALLGLLTPAFVPALTGSAAAARPRASLRAFSSCTQLLAYAHAGALRTGGTPGVVMRAGGDLPAIAPPVAVPQANGTTGTVAPVAAAPASGNAKADTTTADPSFSTTNDQEAGVDEPDLVKTDGRYVYAVTDRTLRIIDVQGVVPRVVGTLALDGYGQQLLLRKDRLLVLASARGFGYPGPGPVPLAASAMGAAPRQVASIAPYPYPGYGRALLTEVDVSDRTAPKVARAMTVDGDYVDARLTGATARVVIGSAPDPIVATATRSLRQAIAATGTSRFIPRTVLRSAISGRTFRRPLARCDEVRRPRAFSGTGLLTIMTVDLDRGLYSVDRDGVMAGAQTVYGSQGSLYVASRRYSPAVEDGRNVPQGTATQIARFDASRPGVTTYRSSGEVPGFLLNQYAMSEEGGYLRVASTEEPLWFPDGSGPATDGSSRVTVLAERDGALVPLGHAGDLGHGQRIYAVRFTPDAAYVVTFKQVDPLYVVDLTTPSAPRVRGQLELTGYSAYLHPIGDGLLLGVGQEATAAGRLAGSQVSLFDVSDPEHPRRVAQKRFGPGSSAVESDPHAFLYWPATRLAVLPLTTYDGAEGSGTSAAVGLRVTAAGIADAGQVTHPVDGGQAPIDRSLVVGDHLYTLSYAGLGRSALDTLAPAGFAAFPRPQPQPQPQPQPSPGPVGPPQPVR
ncbi:beta-propeller domain-containing protein [Paraconexibacter antarcticus]|uniref:Beta-propeller domain-containing protein n=1 Tax=Paraconexibacter antarcticus TaxID=2949664 RepID=A0ABY5E0S5_9ACTN|nr:beta-propeller domain-containing protein [Paraconexibacter antarcticus]UTI66414.1 beta-propeller domain-containing protein [Paraconexibacter antarcticus]